MFYVQSLLYCFLMLFNRLAILLVYYGCFHSHPTRIIISVIISMVVGIGIGSVFTSIFQCTPVRYSWDKAVEGHCLDSNEHYLGGPVTGFLLDLVILILPLEPLWRVRLPTRTKLGVMFVLFSVVCECSQLLISSNFDRISHFF